MASVTFADVEKRYGDVPVIDRLNLEVKDREFMVLVGPSGSGKSTALRMLAGLEEISGGTISIDGRRVNDVAPRDRNIAMVFQSYALYPHMSVKENLAFGLRLRKTPQPEIDRLVGETAKLLGISLLLDRKPKQLSGGERQRVAVGRAIMRKPAVFLFDEPLSNLDAKLRVQMRAEIKKLQNDLGVTTVYVTHDQVEAMTMGHRVAVLREGGLQQCDTPSTLYHEPANLFVAGFIGSPAMNTLPVARTGPVEIAGVRIGVDDDLDGDRTIIGFRPEAVVVGSGSIPARIRVVEDLGSEVFVHVLIDHLGEERRLVARAEAPFHGQSGDNVQLSLRGAAHLFDEAEERRTTVTL